MKLEQVLSGIGEGKFRVIYYDLARLDKPEDSFFIFGGNGNYYESFAEARAVAIGRQQIVDRKKQKRSHHIVDDEGEIIFSAQKIEINLR